MPVNTRNEFRGHVKRAKRNKFEVTTKRAAKHSTTLGGIPTVNQSFYILNNRGSGTKFINDVFIIVRKNGL